MLIMLLPRLIWLQGEAITFIDNDNDNDDDNDADLQNHQKI